MSGMNVIDTSPNYTDGKSEVLVGNVLSGLVEAQNLSRDVCKEILCFDH